MWKKRFSLLLAPLTVLFSFAIVSIYRKNSAAEIPLALLHLMDTMESYDYSYFNSAYDGDKTYYDAGNGKLRPVGGEGVGTTANYYGFGNGEDMLGISGVNGYNDYLKSLVAGGETLPTVVIAVMDSGINLGHEIFAGRVMVAHGKNFAIGQRGDDTTDSLGHGTHVAGVICDTTLPNVKILPIKIFGETASINPSNVIPRALEYIVGLKNSGMNIVAVNMSLGTDPITPTQANAIGSGYTEYLNWQFEMYQEYVDTLTAAKILPIVAAGNNEGGGSTYPSLPAACEGTVSVSAFDAREFENYDIDKDDVPDPGEEWEDADDDGEPDANNASVITRMWKSNHGDAARRSRVDIAAPGYYIWSARNSGTTELKLLSGTSQATPYVAAVYALLYSDPTVDWEAEDANRGEYLTSVAKVLMENAMEIGSAVGNMEGNFGAGCVSLLSVPHDYSKITIPNAPPAGKAKVTAETSGGGMVLYSDGGIPTPIGEYVLADKVNDFSVSVGAGGGYHVLKVTIDGETVYEYAEGQEKKGLLSAKDGIPPVMTSNGDSHTIIAEFSVFSSDDLKLPGNTEPTITTDDNDIAIDPRIWVGLMFVAGVVIVGINLIKNRRKTAESEAEEIMRELREAQGGEDNGNY